MTVTALRIDLGGTAERIELPDGPDGQRQVLRDLVGGGIDRGVYHRKALVHVHGEGAVAGQPLNLGAWVLACAWRGLELNYGLHGTVAVTGPDRGDGGVDALDDALLAQAEAVCASVRDIMVEWRTRRPVSEQAARSELLAAGQHQVAKAGR